MVISSRTPEGSSGRCVVCGSELKVEPSEPLGDAPCPRCGHLIWFEWEDLGDVDVIKPVERTLSADELAAFLNAVAIRPGVHLVLDLAQVEYLASASLAQLINLKKRLKSVGGRLTIRNLHTDLLEIFRITRLDHLFEIQT